MDDEDTLLPRKLQAALEQALERKDDLINQDSDSESDEGKRGWEQGLYTAALAGWTRTLFLETREENKNIVNKLTSLLQKSICVNVKKHFPTAYH